MLICCVILGYIIAAIYFYPRLWKTKKEYYQLIKFNNELKKLHDLNHIENEIEEQSNPEGIEFEDEDDSFFKE